MFNRIICLLIAISALAAAVAVGVFAVFGYGWRGILVIVGIIIAFPVSDLLHESGHVIFGLFAKIKAVPQIRLFYPSYCKLIPLTDRGLKGRVVAVSLGGIALNAVLLAIGVCGFFIDLFPLWLTAVIPANLYLLLLNAFPLYLPQGKTDGAVVSELIRGDANAEVMLAVLKVQAQLLKGKKIEEVEENLLFGLPVVCEDEPAFISLTELRYEFFKAKGETEKAEDCKKRLEELKKYL